MHILRRLPPLPALAGLILVLALVAGSASPVDAATSRQRAHAKAAVAKAQKNVAASRQLVRRTEQSYVTSLESRQRAVDAATAAATAYGTAEGRRQAAAADLPPKEAAYADVSAALGVAWDDRDPAVTEYDGAELGLSVANDLLEREKNKWAACTRSSGSFQCKKTQNGSWEPAPEVERLYQARERAQAKFERARAALAAVDQRIGELTVQANRWRAAVEAARAESAAATQAADAALVSKNASEARRTAAGTRVVAAKNAVHAAGAKLVKAQQKLRRAKARLRRLS